VPWNFFLLPLLGGYCCFLLCHRLRFYGQRLEGYRLLFETALAGVGLALAARLSILFLLRPLPGGAELRNWGALVYGVAPFSGTAAAALLLGVFGALGFNLLYALWLGRRWVREAGGSLSAVLRFRGGLRALIRSLGHLLKAAEDYALDRAILGLGSGLEQFLREAINRPKGTELAVEVVTRERKVFIGYVTELSPLRPLFRSVDPFVGLILVMTGHEDPTTLKVVLDRSSYQPKDEATKRPLLLRVETIRSVRFAPPVAAQLSR
jgi:hypothetical protein